MILGPAINFLLVNVNIHIGPYLLNNLSAPGLLMAVAWAFLEILVLFFYTNLHEFVSNSSNLAVVSAEADASTEEVEPLLNNSAVAATLSDEIIPYEVDENEIENNPSEPINSSVVCNASAPSSEKFLFPFFKNRHKRVNQPYDFIRIVDNSETVPLVVRIYDEYIQEEVVAVYTTTFTVFFMQTCLEVCLHCFSIFQFNHKF